MVKDQLAMRIYTIPNIITIFRIALIPIFTYYFLNNNYRLGILLFVIAAFSDIFDGGIARRYHQSSKLGAFLDPAADKLLMLASFLSLGLTGWIPIYVTLLVISRDLYIVFGLWYLKAKNAKIKMGAISVSKLNTFLQLLTASFAFLRALQYQEQIHFLKPLEGTLFYAFEISMWAMVLTILLSTYKYTRLGLSFLRAEN